MSRLLRLGPNQSSNPWRHLVAASLFISPSAALTASCLFVVHRATILLEVFGSGGAFDEHTSMRCAFAFAVVHARLVRKLLRVMLAAKSWLLSRRHTLVVGSTLLRKVCFRCG